jgi:hypothetical protein
MSLSHSMVLLLRISLGETRKSSSSNLLSLLVVM